MWDAPGLRIRISLSKYGIPSKQIEIVVMVYSSMMLNKAKIDTRPPSMIEDSRVVYKSIFRVLCVNLNLEMWFCGVGASRIKPVQERYLLG